MDRREAGRPPEEAEDTSGHGHQSMARSGSDAAPQGDSRPEPSPHELLAHDREDASRSREADLQENGLHVTGEHRQSPGHRTYSVSVSARVRLGPRKLLLWAAAIALCIATWKSLGMMRGAAVVWIVLAWLIGGWMDRVDNAKRDP
jgi:hypothetical protein